MAKTAAVKKMAMKAKFAAMKKKGGKFAALRKGKKDKEKGEKKDSEGSSDY